MSIIDNWLDNLATNLAGRINNQMQQQYKTLGKYYSGDHRPQLKTKAGRQDDNVILNFIALAVDRSVSRLFRGGVDFNLPDGADNQQEYIDTVWDLNRQEISLYQVGLHGTVYGTCYYKVVPDGIADPYTGEAYPRLIPVYPEIIRVETDPQDMNVVEEYTIEYTVSKKMNEFTTQEVGYREITRRDRETDYQEAEAMGFWIIEYWERVGSSGRWTLVNSEQWPYDFPPIIHWKNLPSLNSCYGDSDIDDAINIQDKENLTVSDIGKIIKYHASPQTVGTGFSADQLKPIEGSVNAFHAVSNADAKIYNLEMSSDLASSRSHALDLRQSIFDIVREVDLSSIADKLGALTNFGLRVLYGDAIDKNDTKRQLYGDALIELNRRLLVLAGYEGEESRPGQIAWGEALIVNTSEEIQTDKIALEMGIVDKETIQQRYQDRYGISWEDLQTKLAEQATAANENNSNIGAFIMRNFNRGGGA